MDNFTFKTNNTKKNMVLVPEGFYRGEDYITGIYIKNSIRFYKNNMEDKLTYEYLLSLYPNISYKGIRFIRRSHHSAMCNFDIVDEFIKLKGNRTVQDKYYNFNNGIVVVKNDDLMDVVEKDRLQNYLETYGFDISKGEILSNDEIVIKGNKKKVLNISLRH